MRRKIKAPKKFRWRHIPIRLLGLLHDDRGAVMAEYIMVTGIVVPLAAYLFHPDNGFYQAMRTQYDLTTLLLKSPGP